MDLRDLPRWIEGIENAMGEEVINSVVPSIIASVINRIPVDSGRTLRSAEITTPYGVVRAMSNSRAAVKRELTEKVKQAVRGRSTAALQGDYQLKISADYLPYIVSEKSKGNLVRTLSEQTPKAFARGGRKVRRALRERVQRGR